MKGKIDAIKSLSFQDVKREILELSEKDPHVETLARRKPNWIIDHDEKGLWIKTVRSGDEPKHIPWWMFETTWNVLLERNEIEQNYLVTEKKVMRGAAVCSILAKLPYIGFKTHPRITIYLNEKQEIPPSIKPNIPPIVITPPNTRSFGTPWLDATIKAALAVWNVDPKFPICLLRPALEHMVKLLYEKFEKRDGRDFVDMISYLINHFGNLGQNKKKDLCRKMHYVRRVANEAIHWERLSSSKITYKESIVALEDFQAIARWWETEQISEKLGGECG